MCCACFVSRGVVYGLVSIACDWVAFVGLFCGCACKIEFVYHPPNHLALFVQSNPIPSHPKPSQVVQKTIQSSFRHVTLLVIAHRLSTVMGCTKILALGGGHVLEYVSVAKRVHQNTSNPFATYTLLIRKECRRVSMSLSSAAMDGLRFHLLTTRSFAPQNSGTQDLTSFICFVICTYMFSGVFYFGFVSVAVPAGIVFGLSISLTGSVHLTNCSKTRTGKPAD